MVVVDADTAVVADTATLHLEVEAGATAASLEPTFTDTVDAQGPGTLPWPVRLALVPRDDDDARLFRVRVEARDADGDPVVHTRVRSGYVQGHTKLLALWLEDACRDVDCDADERCVDATCTSEAIDPTDLPDYEPDAPDGGAPECSADPDCAHLDSTEQVGDRFSCCRDENRCTCRLDRHVTHACEGGQCVGSSTQTLTYSDCESCSQDDHTCHDGSCVPEGDVQCSSSEDCPEREACDLDTASCRNVDEEGWCGLCEPDCTCPGDLHCEDGIWQCTGCEPVVTPCPDGTTCLLGVCEPI